MQSQGEHLHVPIYTVCFINMFTISMSFALWFLSLNYILIHYRRKRKYPPGTLHDKESQRCLFKNYSELVFMSVLSSSDESDPSYVPDK